MTQIHVRPALSTDLERLAAFDHSYSTDYVWQMDMREEAGQIAVIFRQVRLPRSMRVAFPRDPRHLMTEWSRRVCFLVAEEEKQLKGYLNLTLAPARETGWIADFGVDRRFRHMGVGSVLLAAALQWARENHLQRVILEAQAKNFPAIRFAQKNGLIFCGYSDRYYPNQDVAIFFGMTLK